MQRSKDMTPKFFLTYIGLFFTCSVTLAAVVKQFSSGFAASGRKPYVYGALSSFAASGLAYLTTLISENLYEVYWFLAVIYLLFGIIHVSFVRKKYFYTGNQSPQKILTGEIMFGLSIILFTVVVFSALQYFVKSDRSFLFYPVLLSSITFFIPLLFMKTFEAAYSIPSACFKTWHYPLNTQIEIPAEKPGERIFVIGFGIAKKATDRKKTHFRAKAPEGMMLGELYYHFINDYNDTQSETPIQFTGEGFEPQEWWFRRKPKWYQVQRILDPDISVRENGIKENTIILCERIDLPLQS